jgi:hypothetical protein
MARIKLHVDIDGSNAPTLNINGTGAKPIVTTGGYAFGVIKAGTWVLAIYDEERDAYVFTESSEIINLPHGAISIDDYIPFFDVAGNRSSRVMLSELLQITAGATGFKKEIDRFTETGTWVCPENVTYIDAWLVGGGGSGGTNGVGGGGGFCRIVRDIPVTPGKEYSIVVGVGGSNNSNGGSTVAFDYEVEGGESGANGGGGSNNGGAAGNDNKAGGDGGSFAGGGARYLGVDWNTTNPYDGVDYAGGGGGAGVYETTIGGKGGGSFAGSAAKSGGYGGGEAGSASWFSAGGGGGGSYGGGGGGSYSEDRTGGKGGDGIVIIYASVMSATLSALPVWEGGRF